MYAFLAVLSLVVTPIEPDPAEFELQAELAQFPPAAVVDDALEMNRSHRRWLLEKMDGPCGWLYVGWYRENEQYGWTWSYLKFARDKSLSLASRERYLRNLRRRITRLMGADAARLNLMPPPVPLWRYFGP